MNIILEVSVICTVKNGEKTIEKTINSVIEQTFQNWEFILVDDGSTDNTKYIIRKYQKIDKRIKLVETQGIGRGKALNLAVKETIGNYIVNIDADDLMHPKKLEIQYQVVKKEVDYFLISTLHRIIYDLQDIEWEDVNNENIKVENISEKNFKKNQVDHSSVIMRKDELLSLGGYDESRKSQFDYELWLRAAYNGFKLGRINQKLVAKRIHDKQSFERKRYSQLLRSVFLQIKFILKEKKLSFLIYPFGRIVLGLLPFKVRLKIKDVIKI